MKKKLFILIPALTLALLMISCSKDDTQPPAITTEGKYNGTYSLVGGPPSSSYISLHFKSGGVLAVEANDATSPDLASGTYTVAGDSVKGSFIYSVGIGVNYLFAGKYSSNNTIINGTIGISPDYSGNATFTVTKQ